jgi:hypothetical protein
MFCLAVGSTRYCALADIFGKGRSPNWNHLQWRPSSQIRSGCCKTERIATSKRKKTWISMALKIVHSQMGRVISGAVSIYFVAIIHSQMGQVLSGAVWIHLVEIMRSQMGQVISCALSIQVLAIIHSQMGQAISCAVSIRFLAIIHSQMGQVWNGIVSINLVSNCTEPKEADSKRYCINKSRENYRWIFSKRL